MTVGHFLLPPLPSEACGQNSPALVWTKSAIRLEMALISLQIWGGQGRQLTRQEQGQGGGRGVPPPSCVGVAVLGMGAGDWPVGKVGGGTLPGKGREARWAQAAGATAGLTHLPLQDQLQAEGDDACEQLLDPAGPEAGGKSW